MRRRMVQQEGASVDWERCTPLSWRGGVTHLVERAAHQAPTAREFGLVLLHLCQPAGVPVTIDGTKVYCLACRLALPGELDTA
jgi:hypothetical protein